MRGNIFAAALVIALFSLLLNSCETPVGQGAGWGAATGAIIGGAATGHVRGAAIGAAAGAAAGALFGQSRKIKPSGTVRRRRAAFRWRVGLEHLVFTTALIPAAFTIFAEFRLAD